MPKTKWSKGDLCRIKRGKVKSGEIYVFLEDMTTTSDEADKMARELGDDLPRTDRIELAAEMARPMSLLVLATSPLPHMSEDDFEGITCCPTENLRPLTGAEEREIRVATNEKIIGLRNTIEHLNRLAKRRGY